MALTRALLHPADSIAWLSILRAPWCGLDLNDLCALAAENRNLTIWELITQPEKRGELSSDGQSRLQRTTTLLMHSLRKRRQGPLRDLIEGTWIALGGPAAVRSETELEEAQMLFQLLEQFDHGGDIDDFGALDDALNDLYAPPSIDGSDRLQLMTIHAAKGLEFDQVIIPGLSRMPRQDDSKLLYWLERTAAEGFSDLLLAPIKGADDIEDKIYQYLKLLVAEKEQLEVARLLYVAATRARKQLHLLGSVAYGKDGIKEPNKRSLLATLWSAQEIRSDFQQLAYDDQSEFKDESQTIDDDHPIRRLPLGWTVPEEELISPLPQITTESIPEAGQLERVEFDWASETARHIGTLVHRYLQRIAKDGLGKWDQQKITALRHAFGNVLLNMGVPKSELKGAVARVDRALNQILIDERGGWILSAQHQDARSEYALSSLLNGKLVNVIIDRTFIDASGYRWIIDYKTGMHSGSDIEEFLDREQERYCKQLERYAAIFRKIEDKPIRLGLYFPLMSGWRSWDY
jgi:ATP-dependent exoDNAse (exonuclease V) beta subunit